MKRITSLMILALTLVPCGSALAEKPEWNRNAEPKSLIPVPDPPRRSQRPHREPTSALQVQVWVDGGDDATFYPGETVNLHFRASRDAYVILYDIDTQGNVNRLYPRSGMDEQFVEGGVIYDVPTSRAGYRLVASGPSGYEYVGAIASDRPLVGRWDRSDDRRVGNRWYSGSSASPNLTTRIDTDPQSAMDQLYTRLVEVPVEERWDNRPQTARDEVRFLITNPSRRHRRN